MCVGEFTLFPFSFERAFHWVSIRQHCTIQQENKQISPPSPAHPSPQLVLLPLS